MPDSGLHIIGEHFERVNHHLLALPGATLGDDPHGPQPCPRAVAVPQADPRARPRAGRRAPTRPARAAEIAERGDPTVAAIASELAGEIYGLVSLKENIEDAEHNTTRFLIMSREPQRPPRGDPDGHDLRVPGPQRAGGALQGDGRVRHQRRQHDQARKLHGRRRVRGDPVLRRCRGPSRGPAAARWRSRSWRSFRARSRSSASTRPTRCASPPRRARQIEEGFRMMLIDPRRTARHRIARFRSGRQRPRRSST